MVGHAEVFSPSTRDTRLHDAQYGQESPCTLHAPGVALRHAFCHPPTAPRQRLLKINNFWVQGSWRIHESVQGGVTPGPGARQLNAGSTDRDRKESEAMLVRQVHLGVTKDWATKCPLRSFACSDFLDLCRVRERLR